SANPVINDEKRMNFLTFVQDIYINCTQLKIPPSHIFSWIKDLLDHRICFSNDTKPFSLNNQSKQKKENEDYNNNDNTKQALGSASTYKSGLPHLQLQSKNELDIDDIYQPSSSIHNTNEILTSDSPFNILKDNLKTEEIKIPFISQLSFFINQKKKICAKLENEIKNLKNVIKDLQDEKNQLVYDKNQIIKSKKFILSYINWFSKLKKDLWENYSIAIEDDIQDFSKLVSDFKEHGYDAHQIIKEYLRSLSIKLEIKTIESHIATLSVQRESLNNNILSMRSQIEIHKQTLDAYYQLEVMGFGLKELKKLWNTIREIGSSNRISSDEAYKKFFKDIEEDYDNKLGFDAKVHEKRNELYQLKNQLIVDRFALQLQPYVGTVLQNLFQNGVNEEDIINMNSLITKFSKSKDISTTSYPLNTEISKGEQNLDTDNKNERTKYWKLFIYNLEKLNDIQSEIREQTENRNRVQKELDYLNKQKQESAAYAQIATSFINAINQRISYLKGCMDFLNSEMEKKTNNKYPIYSHLLPVVIIFNDVQKENKDDSKDKKT
ncbi:MAG: hypothetical protein ACTHKJ_11620, partial [Candidatus Nitrosocosmicus sp.]